MTSGPPCSVPRKRYPADPLPEKMPEPLLPAVALGKDAPKEKDHDAALEALRRGEVLPLTRILPIVHKRVPGDVVKIKLDEDNDTGRINYSVKVLTPDGRIIEVEVDARTAVVTDVEEE